jgi:hypothetical protein
MKNTFSAPLSALAFAAVLAAPALARADEPPAPSRHHVEVAASLARGTFECHPCDGYNVMASPAYMFGVTTSYRYAFTRWFELGAGLTAHVRPGTNSGTDPSEPWLSYASLHVSVPIIASFSVPVGAGAFVVDTGVGYRRMDGSIEGAWWSMNGSSALLGVGGRVPVTTSTEFVARLSSQGGLGRYSERGASDYFPMYVAGNTAFYFYHQLELGVRFAL